MTDDRTLWVVRVRGDMDGVIQVSIDNGYWLGPTQLDSFAEHFARVLEAIASLRDDA